jgi:8-oxo-dGTP diphosphatase
LAPGLTVTCTSTYVVTQDDLDDSGDVINLATGTISQPVVPSSTYPGGTAEVGETPQETLLREVQEEVAIDLPPDAIIWSKFYPSRNQPGQWNWFYVARLPADAVDDVVLGDEGQRWDLVSVETFLTFENVVPSFPPCLREWIATDDGQNFVSHQRE